MSNISKEIYNLYKINKYNNISIKYIDLLDIKSIDNFLQLNRANLFNTLVHKFLRNYTNISDFDINGYLNIYPLHLFTNHQLSILLNNKQYDKWLDIGAGYGNITNLLSNFTKNIIATETSKAMAKQLSLKYEVWNEDISETIDNKREYYNTFDGISVLNVIDRTSKPLTLLKSINKLLKSNGILLLATPLPLRPFYFKSISILENSYSKFAEPLEKIDIPNNEDSWFIQADYIMNVLLPQYNYEVIEYTRLPYVSGGDYFNEYFLLDDLIVVAKKIN